MTAQEAIAAIRAEIERLKADMYSRKGHCKRTGLERIMYKVAAYNEVLTFIDSLPAETASSEVDLEKEIRNYDSYLDESGLTVTLDAIARHFAEWGAEHLRDTTKMIPEGLDEAAQKYSNIPYNFGEFVEIEYEFGEPIETIVDDKVFVKDAFKAGAEWMAGQFEKNRLVACDEQTKEEYDRETELVDKIVTEEHRMPTFSDAIIYGINWQKQQMEKEAVEGYIEGNWREQEDAPYELYAISDELDSTKYKIGDKVKLIILKDDGV